tara:strand:+ start:5266 stop:5580 length:315 start_codon:yes stop_codon:yes gene_type:complete
MNNSDTLIKAALNRISARLGEKIVNTVAEIALLAEEAPERFQKEWELLKEEIYAEAERLKEEDNNCEEVDPDSKPTSDSQIPLAQIDKIREKVRELNKKIEIKK